MAEIVNAKAEGVSLGSDDHGGITMWITLAYSRGSVQGFGGYDLRWWGAEYIQRMLSIFDVEQIDEIVGKTCRVDRGERNLEGIAGIGHITDDIWFYPKKEAATWKGKKK
jgi:hypothetical protein